ncbi:hypothetical protein F1880_002250 [Penicillium rolfsii]|nr:hypothetical protein F1880_002250 [Penicillium rolfsii]
MFYTSAKKRRGNELTTLAQLLKRKLLFLPWKYNRRLFMMLFCLFVEDALEVHYPERRFWWTLHKGEGLYTKGLFAHLDTEEVCISIAD